MHLKYVLIDKNLKRQDSALLYEILRDGRCRIFITIKDVKMKNMSLQDYMTNPCIITVKDDIEWTPSQLVYEYANKWGGVHNDRYMSEKYQCSCKEHKIVGHGDDSRFIMVPTLSYYLCHTAFMVVQIGSTVIRNFIERGYKAQRMWHGDNIGCFEYKFSDLISVFKSQITVY